MHSSQSAGWYSVLLMQHGIFDQSSVVGQFELFPIFDSTKKALMSDVGEFHCMTASALLGSRIILQFTSSEAVVTSSVSSPSCQHLVLSDLFS